jgi:hypothetical protein
MREVAFKAVPQPHHRARALGHSTSNPCLRLALTVALAFLSHGCRGEKRETAEGTATRSSGSEVTASGPTEQPDALQALGSGFVVWESNRTGAWRIWARDFDAAPRQLSPEEPGKRHCCPHISPDGTRIAYGSFTETGRPGYPGGQEAGALHLVRPDGSQDRVLVDSARTYFENRAAVWRSASELIFIDGQGTTRLVDLDSEESRPLIRDPAEAFGWLVDRTLAHATTGKATFSPLLSGQRKVAARAELGGCQPYFSHHGRWGFSMAGAGGPIERIDLRTRETTSVLRKSDVRLPSDRGYLYFPMLSRDGGLLAFGASRFEHDHSAADYDIFVTETDAASFEVIGDAIRVTEHPATDRFPDIFSTPLALGRHSGEAPFSVQLEADDADATWSWETSDGRTSEGTTATLDFEEVGVHRVVARHGDRELKGIVRVTEPRPPRVLDVALVENGEVIRVSFDEPIQLSDLRASLASGAALGDARLGPAARSLNLGVESPLPGADTLRLEGVADRAQVPNVLAATELEVPAPLWPTRRQGLAFLWEAADAANLIYDTTLDAERANSFVPSGRARLDHDFAMAPAGGRFTAVRDDADYLRHAVQRSNELSIELVLTPAKRSDGVILAFGPDRKRRNFALVQRGERLLVGLRLAAGGARGELRHEIAGLRIGSAQHVTFTYRPGRLTTFVDGVEVHTSDALQGGFFHWKTRQLYVGDGSWAGKVEGLALYSRVLEDEEVAENARRHRAMREARPSVPRLVVDARLEQLSRVPTLAEISPYREALSVDRYRVLDVVEGTYEGSTLRAARWALQDGEHIEVSGGEAPRLRLVLEAFLLNPQLESVYTSDTLSGTKEPLFYVVESTQETP